MVNKVAIETEQFAKVIKNIESTALECTLNDTDFLAYKKTKGTDIMSYLSVRADRVSKVTDKYQAMVSTSFVSSLDDIKTSMVHADKNAANHLQLGKGPINVEQ